MKYFMVLAAFALPLFAGTVHTPVFDTLVKSENHVAKARPHNTFLE